MHQGRGVTSDRDIRAQSDLNDGFDKTIHITEPPFYQIANCDV